MKRKNTTRNALFTSIISMLLCVSMLVGTTFAWFTDEVKSGVNTIAAGNLDVELYHGKDANPVDKVDEGTLLFTDVGGNVIDQWEPGVVAFTNLKVANVGTLALKYQLSINSTEMNHVKDTDLTLADALQVAVVEGGVSGDRAAVIAKGTEAGWEDLESFTLPGVLEADKKSETYGIVIYWEPGANEHDNQFNMNNGKTTSDGKPLTITLGVNLFATQEMYEDDSFGPDYDKDAWVDGFDVYSAQDLQAALNNGETAIDLMADIETAESIVIPANAAVALNLNGKSLGGNIEIPAGAKLTVGNGTIANTDSGVSGIQNNGGELVLDNVTVESARHGVRVEGGNVTINSGEFIVAPTSNMTVHALNVSDGATVTINGGTFVGPKGTIADSGSAVCVQSGSTVIINGGNFSGGKNSTLATKEGANLTVKGGIFDQDPSAYVHEDYHAVENNGLYYVVADTIADGNVVGNADELKSALSGAADAGSGDNTLYLIGDIDLTDSDWTPISVDGYHGAGVITIEGNGATITGLNAPLFAGGFAGKSGIVIKNLTIADSNIVSTSGLGGGAFVDSADSMHVITLENCHLVNSTVSGERAGGLIGWCTGYAKLDDGPVKAYVTISNCSVVDSTVTGAGSAGAIAGHPGASDYTYTTIENCVVKNVDVVSNDSGSWRTGAIVGTANNGHVVINNVTVEDVTLTQNGVTAEETKLYGRFVPSGTGTLVIDGKFVVETADQLAAAVANGETNLYLADGEYNIYGCGGKTLTLSGSKNAVLKLTNEGEDGCDYGFGSAGTGVGTYTFNGLTIDTTGNTGNYKGYAYMKGIFNDCNFVGAYSLNNANDFVFNRCTFDFKNGYFWTWGAKSVTFDGCTFNGNSKAILAHGSASTVININNCTFAATEKGYTGAGDNTAVVEMDPTASNTYTINFTGENTKTEHYAGWTRVKDGSTGHTITGVN